MYILIFYLKAEGCESLRRAGRHKNEQDGKRRREYIFFGDSHTSRVNGCPAAPKKTAGIHLRHGGTADLYSAVPLFSTFLGQALEFAAVLWYTYHERTVGIHKGAHQYENNRAAA